MTAPESSASERPQEKTPPLQTPLNNSSIFPKKYGERFIKHRGLVSSLSRRHVRPCVPVEK
jgi:hypothetical protein